MEVPLTSSRLRTRSGICSTGIHSKPVPPALPEVVHINPPQPTNEEETTPELGKPEA